MVFAAVNIPGSSTVVVTEHRHEGIRRSDSGPDLSRMRRSLSSPQLRCSVAAASASLKGGWSIVVSPFGSRMRRSPSAPQLQFSPAAPSSVKSSRSFGAFPCGSMITNSIRSLLFDSEEEEEDAGGGLMLVEPESDEEVGGTAEETIGQGKRANWVARILELSQLWSDRQPKDEEVAAGEEDSYCGVSYDSEDGEEEGNGSEWDRESFSRLLGRVSWYDAKLFFLLALLCNMAYTIPEIKAAELWNSYELGLVTSSFVKKSGAAVKASLESNSTRSPVSAPSVMAQANRPVRPSVAYEVAASAACYMHSRAKGPLSPSGAAGPRPRQAVDSAEALSGPNSRCYKNPELAAYVAASTMTAVVAAEDEARQEAAKGLRSAHSSPCEWFVCDHESTRTRCFVIQGSDSLESWQANLFFEPTNFERMDVLVHRGIYEAAKGIYEQFLPEIQEHLSRHGDRARLQFTGHSLGGSLCLLVGLMLLARGDVKLRHLLPVVTFGSPSVFCGGQRVLEALGLDEGFVRSVMMHRDIVPRAFSCNYPSYIAQILKRVNGPLRSHPCLNDQKVLYTPLGQTYILQPDNKFTPFHPMLPQGAALFVLDGKNSGGSSSKAATASALRAFINSPHPLETLSDLRAYGSAGTILRDHDSSNYANAMARLVRQQTNLVRPRSQRQWLQIRWPPVTLPANGLPSCRTHHNPVLEKPALVANELVSRV